MSFLSLWGHIKWRPWYLGQFIWVIWVLQHAVSQNKNYPEVVSRKKNNFYADNLSNSLDTEVGKEEKGHKGRQRITSDRSSWRVLHLPQKGFSKRPRWRIELNPSLTLITPYQRNTYLVSHGTEMATAKSWGKRIWPHSWQSGNSCQRCQENFTTLEGLPVITYAKLLFQEVCKLRTGITPIKKPNG